MQNTSCSSWVNSSSELELVVSMLMLHVAIFCDEVKLISSFFSPLFACDACPQLGGKNCSKVIGSQLGRGKGASPSNHGTNLEGMHLLLGSDLLHILDGAYFDVVAC